LTRSALLKFRLSTSILSKRVQTQYISQASDAINQPSSSSLTRRRLIGDIQAGNKTKRLKTLSQHSEDLDKLDIEDIARTDLNPISPLNTLPKGYEPYTLTEALRP